MAFKILMRSDNYVVLSKEDNLYQYANTSNFLIRNCYHTNTYISSLTAFLNKICKSSDKGPNTINFFKLKRDGFQSMYG